jgi:lysophospholipase
VEAPGAFHEILMETDERRAVFWRAFDDLARRVGA